MVTDILIDMSALLRQYIMEVVAEVNDPRVPNQLVPKGSSKSKKDKEQEIKDYVAEVKRNKGEKFI